MSTPTSAGAESDPSPTTDDRPRLNSILIPAASEALERARARHGLSRADAVNHALQLYGFIVDQLAAGGTLLIRDAQGSVNRVDVRFGPDGEAL